MKHLYLGQASNYMGVDVFRHLFTFGTKKDSDNLREYLAEHYHTVKSHVFLTGNGRSALALALMSLDIPKHSSVLINGFTCYAVVQAVKAAGFTPVYADIDRESLNFTPDTLEKMLKKDSTIHVVILQNTLGNPADYRAIAKCCKKYNIKLIEDLAHCAGLRYTSGVEMGTIGDATCLSFGKGKSIDTITGGALVLNQTIPDKLLPKIPTKHHLSDSLRARWYPVFGFFGRFFERLGIGKYWYGPLIRLGFIRRAVDERLDTSIRPAHWQSRLALKQIKNFNKDTRSLRSFVFVKNRKDLLKELEKHGFHFREIWYDVPISPVRYYSSLHFDESACPVSTRVSKEILNLPTYYTKEELAPALKIIEEYKIYD